MKKLITISILFLLLINNSFAIEKPWVQPGVFQFGNCSGEKGFVNGSSVPGVIGEATKYTNADQCISDYEFAKSTQCNQHTTQLKYTINKHNIGKECNAWLDEEFTGCQQFMDRAIASCKTLIKTQNKQPPKPTTTQSNIPQRSGFETHCGCASGNWSKNACSASIEYVKNGKNSWFNLTSSSDKCSRVNYHVFQKGVIVSEPMTTFFKNGKGEDELICAGLSAKECEEKIIKIEYTGCDVCLDGDNDLTTQENQCMVHDQDINREYEGECKDGYAHGFGTAQGQDFYQGEFVDGYKHGKGNYKWSDGDSYYGDFVEGVRTGKGIYTWQNDDEYKGVFLDGKRTGKGKMTFASGKKYKGYFIDGKLNGKGSLTWANGDRYYGDFLDGKRNNGKGSLTWANGDNYYGDFLDGKRTGKGTYTWKNSHRYQYTGDWLDGERHGKGYQLFADLRGSLGGQWEYDKYIYPEKETYTDNNSYPEEDTYTDNSNDGGLNPLLDVFIKGVVDYQVNKQRIKQEQQRQYNNEKQRWSCFVGNSYITVDDPSSVNHKGCFVTYE